MSNSTTTVRYQYRQANPQFPKMGATWLRIETSDLAGIIVERITPVAKPESPEPLAEPVKDDGNASEQLGAPFLSRPSRPAQQLAFSF